MMGYIVNQSGGRRRSIRRLGVVFALLLVMTTLGGMAYSSALAQQDANAFAIKDVLVEDISNGLVNPADVVVDSAGNRYVVGEFEGDGDFGEGGVIWQHIGNNDDQFIASYDAAGRLRWLQEIESVGDDPVTILSPFQRRWG